MEKNIRSMLGDSGFYAALAVCLLVVGVGGYFLLFDRDAPSASTETPPVVEETDVLPPQEEESTPATAIQPALAVEEAVSMPETVPDATPVVAEAPQITVTPLSGDVLTAFSVDELVYSETLADWRTHDGVDIAAPLGDAVLAARAGTVAAVTEDPLMGTTVVIDHSGGCQTTYASLQASPDVAVGDAVSAGQAIGSVGSTAAAEAAQGPHLHFAVTQDGDAVDPSGFLNK